MVFFVDVQHGLDQLKLTSKMVKQQLANGFVQLVLKTSMNLIKYFKKQLLHGLNAYKIIFGTILEIKKVSPLVRLFLRFRFNNFCLF